MTHNLVLSALVLMSTVMPPIAASGQSPPERPRPQVVTTATGEATVVPDRASIVLAVETRAPTAAEAGSSNAELQQRVIGAIVGKGIRAERVTTSGYSIYPNERRGPEGQRLAIEYIARNSVVVDLERIDQLGGVIDAALGAGANVVSSLRLYSSKHEEARRSAMEDAVRKARTDAEVLSRAAGGSLGEPIEIQTADGFSGRPMYEMQRMATAADTPIAAGEQKVTVSVTIRWALVIGR